MLRVIMYCFIWPFYVHFQLQESVQYYEFEKQEENIVSTRKSLSDIKKSM